MTAVNSLPGFPEERPENFRYFTRIIGATPPYWFGYTFTPAVGLADEILEVARGFDSTLTADSHRQEIMLSVMVATDVHSDRLPDRLLLRFQARCKYMRIAIDDESHVVRLTGQIPCADGSRLPLVVRSLFADAARLLNDDRFLAAIDSAK